MEISQKTYLRRGLTAHWEDSRGSHRDGRSLRLTGKRQCELYADVSLALFVSRPQAVS